MHSLVEEVLYSDIENDTLSVSCSKICRLCGAVCESNLNIFGEENADLKLWTKLKTVVAIVVHKDDPFPKGICRTCFEKLEQFSTFQEECQETQIKLNEFLQLQSVISESNTWQRAHSTLEMKCDNRIQNYEEVCNNVREDIMKELQTNKLVQEETNTQTMEIIEAAKMVNISDTECSKLSSITVGTGVVNVAPICNVSEVIGIKESVSDIQESINKKREVKFVSILKDNQSDIRSNDVEPSIAERQSITSDNLINLCTDKALNDECKILSNDAGLPKYIVTRILTSPNSGSVQENQQRVLLIPLLPTNGKMPIPKLSKIHNIPAHSRIQIQHNADDISRTQPSNKNKIVKKKKSHKNRSRSNVRVPTSAYVKKHVERISCSKFMCKLCNETFRWNYQCEYHVRNHTGEKAFVCKDCGKNFSAMHLLKLHMACHVKGYSHLCKDCGKGFRSPTGLKDHERMHLNVEPPYKCSDCGKGFFIHQSYSYHKMNHIKQLNYMCEQCGKKFRHMKHLNQHIFRHSGIKPHNCASCGKSFCRKYNLIQHMNRYKGKNSMCGKMNDKSNSAEHENVL